MKKRTWAVVPAVVALVLGPLAGTAAADGRAGGPPGHGHGHMLVLGLQVDLNGAPVGFRKCVDLAAGKALPLRAHHSHLHTGRAGEALIDAGHVVVPTAPVTRYRNCAYLAASFR